MKKLKNINFYYNFLRINFLLVLFTNTNAMEAPSASIPQEGSAINEAYLLPDSTNILSDNIDELVLKAIKHISENGVMIKDNPKPCQQVYSTDFTLLNPLNRVHNLRGPARKYLCRELLAFFKGSLNVNDGLAQASSVWKSIADENNEIVSNYGYYVFHQELPQAKGMTQYDWVVSHLAKNLDSRKALININQPYHKKLGIKDYPCTIGLQFFVKNNYLCCSISSRSTDAFWGLAYDMGFFSFLIELVYKDLKQRSGNENTTDLKLGYVTMKAHFAQIYDKTRLPALTFLNKFKDYQEKYSTDMPQISDAQETLKDIYNGTQNTEVMKWIYQNAQ